MKISTILSESAREFDEVFTDEVLSMPPKGVGASRAAFHQFLLSKQRAVIEAVVKEAEGMMLTERAEMGNGITALSDLISRLREALTTLSSDSVKEV